MIRKYWIEVRSSLWFVPVILVIVAVGLALGLVQVDVVYAEQLRNKSWQPLLNAGAEGARGMLTAIASSMITVAGVAFSITIVTLSLASTQYTPRILRNFMRDRANQFVLGIFVAIFTYCLIVLRTIRGGSSWDGSGFVPLLAVAFGMVLALLSIFCLIFFIHHVATSIQASSILQAITNETCDTIDELFPEKIGEDALAPDQKLPDNPVEWHPLEARANGYVQHIDSQALLKYACDHEAIVRIERVPGEFAVNGTPLLYANRPLEEDETKLRTYFVIGDFRTLQQDATFGIRQIVDIALKALSPGVNDTSTAVSCLDYLSAILCRLAPREMASPFREEKGVLRVVAASFSFAEFVARSFDEIRLCAAANVTIYLQLFRVIGRVARETPDGERRDALLFHARLVHSAADAAVANSYDRDRLNQELVDLRAALRVTPAAIALLKIEGAEERGS